MSDLIFEHFAECVELGLTSYVNSYKVLLNGEVTETMPKHYQEQEFLSNDLEPICKLLKIELGIAAKLLAMRNAWLGIFESYINLKIQNGGKNTIVGKDNGEAFTDFLVLNSPFWTEHPAISEVIALLNAEQFRINSEIEESRKQNLANSHNPEFIALLNKNREKNLEDIKFCIDEFHFENDKFKSFEEMDAWYAQLEINKAQRKISELKLEIEKREAVMIQAERVIRRYKSVDKGMSASKGKGRPVNDEFRVSIGKKFVSEWVLSLMEVLEVKSCQKLEQLISSHSTKLETDKVTGVLQEVTVPSKATERNWRRWLNGEAIPNYNTFVILLSTKIDFGKCKGKLLQDIPTTPNSNDLQTLLRFI